MMIRNVLLLFCLVLSTAMGAQDIFIDGTVNIINEDVPLPDHTVVALTANGTLTEAVTDADGHYELTVPLTASGSDILVETIDICSGDVLSETIALHPNQIHYQLNFIVCPGVDPPDPSDTCLAFFFAEQLTVDAGLAVHFFSISTATDQLQTWHWDFGDGAESNEESPVHIYAETGTYTVTLTIETADGCTATFSQDVVVIDENTCNCPEDVYDPVCVITASGAFFTFDNSCYAACAGYGPDQYFACDGGCDCPALYDPVCVDTGAGTLTFSNACFAECEGFGPDDWYHCNDCGCPNGNVPVCIATPAGEISFPNICIAQSFGYNNSDVVDCDPGCICPDVYDPVCVATPSGGILTFSNACEAECEGFGPDVYYACDGNDCVCPDNYDPVCILTANGEILTFDNACYAICAGYDDPAHWTNCEDDCVCPDVYDPVCIATTTGVITFGNECEAACFGFGPDDFVPCLNPCNCPDIYDPVCVLTPEGFLYPFDNACEAMCAGFTPDQYVPCDGICNCDDVYDPVCVNGFAGQIEFPNECEALCAGFSPDMFVDCEDPCGCPDIYDPVCVNGSVGQIEFPNECKALCAGFSPEMIVDCDEVSNCNCPEYALPVCVTDANGQELVFDNPCFAVCAGYDNPFAWTNCNDPNCACPDVWDPVCVETGAGKVQFGNACEASCFNFEPADFVSCIDDCQCPDFYDPVCVYTSPNGPVLEFDNACLAECAGYGPDQYQSCNLDCVCDTEYDPVCVQTNTGIIVFSNACVAACAGYGPDHFVDCEPSNCEDCSDEYDPVCVQTDCGPISFPNPCVAQCHGFGPDSYQACDPPVNLCVADFTTEIIDANSLTVIFHDASVSTDPITHWIWNFGDGSTGEGPHVQHTYSEPGVYFVTLTIVTEHCESTSSHHFSLGGGGGGSGPDCQSMFFFSQPGTQFLMTFHFKDMSLGEVTSWHWDFGDGHSSTEQNPVHTYAEPGLYFVTLMVENDDDCTSSATMVVLVNDDIVYEDHCRALFLPIINPDAPEVFFLDLSSSDAISHTWDFGDGTTADGPFAFHNYETPGIYTVTLTITTAGGCSDTYTVTVDLIDQLVTGTPTYSLINNVTETAGIASLHLFPNPSRGESWLHFTADRASDYEIRISNTAGRVLWQQSAFAQRGDNRIQLNVSDYAAGLYFVQIRTAQGQRSLRLIKP